MKALVLISLVCLVLTTAFSGCLSTESVSAAQIKSNTLTIANAGDIHSYEFSMDMRMNMDTTFPGSDSSSTTMSTIADGVVDIANHQLQMEMTSDSVEMPIEVAYILYIIEDVMYMKMGELETQQWIKMDFSQYEFLGDTYWDNYDQIQAQTALLDASQVQKLPDEVVNGVDCYVLQLTPDLNKLFETLTAQFGSSSSIWQGLDLSSFIDAFEIKLWTSKDTNFIMKVYEYILVDSRAMQSSDFMTMEMEVTVFFFNYNSAPNILLPEEAENAVDFMDLYESQFPSEFDLPI